MRLLIRADASSRIGTGHIMRMIALAQAWRDEGGEVVFVCAEITPALEDRLKEERFLLKKISSISGSREDLQETSAFLDGSMRGTMPIALDGYQFNADFQLGLKKAGFQLLAMDDYGHASFQHADWVLNQNISANENLYPHRAPHTRILLGTKFALLRREFLQHGGGSVDIPKIASKVLVTLGGADPDNVTSRVVEALSGMPLELKVVVGGSNPHLTTLRSIVEKSKKTCSRVDLIVNPSGMPELMKWSDLAVAAGGSTAWELSFMGVPSLYFILAENQRAIAMHLEKKGLGICLQGLAEEREFSRLSAEVAKLSADFQMREAFSKNCRSAVDGYGAHRIIEILKGKA